ncbi:MAG: endonuclease III [Atopobiaceae bacterium]
MPRESLATKRQRGVELCARMEERYGQYGAQLDFSTPFTTVIAVMLSAQTTDASVNRVTPELFRRWPTPEAMAQAEPGQVAEVIRSLGFYRSKSQHCVDIARMIMADFGGEVPHTMEELVRLPGVGRKTANIVLNKCFDIVDGIAVDTHVYRIATRMKLTKAPTPLEAERDLLRVLPRDLWKNVNSEWIMFGREYCTSRAPKCDVCPMADICPSAGLDVHVNGKGNGRPSGRKPAGKKSSTSGKASSGQKGSSKSATAQKANAGKKSGKTSGSGAGRARTGRKTADGGASSNGAGSSDKPRKPRSASNTTNGNG